MRIKTDLFCSLSSHPLWQNWLRDNDVEVFDLFIDRFRKSTGCANNAKIMLEILPLLENRGKKIVLAQFLAKHFPNMIALDEEDEELLRLEKYFLANALTFPRRMIITDADDINKVLMSFLDGKIQYEYVLVGNKAYVEYLTEEDTDIQKILPEGKWLLKAYKEKNQRKHPR